MARFSSQLRGFGPQGFAQRFGETRKGFGGTRDASSNDSCPIPPTAAASEILEVGARRGTDDYDARLAALAEAMDGRSEAEQLALIQEVMRQDEGATESWLQLDRLETLGAGTVPWLPKVDQELLDAVEENMLFTPEGMEQFIEGGATDRLSGFQDASKDLRWFVNNHGVAMRPADLQSAVDEFKNGRGDDWNKKLDDTQAAVIADGERILNIINDPRMASLSDAQRSALMQTMIDPENPAGSTVLAMTFDQDGGVEPELLDSAMSFFADTGLRESNPDLATVVANARINAVSRSIEEIDASDPASAAAARAEIAKLRSEDYASLAGIDEDKLDELDATVDALQDTVRPGASSEEIEESLATFAARADELDGPESNVAEGLRLLALQSGSVSLGGNASFGDQAEEAVSNFASLVGFSADTTELLKYAGVIAGTGKVATLLGSRALGGVLVGISALQTLQALGEGDYAEAALGAIGIGIAVFASSTAMCAGLGLVLLAAGFGLDHWRKIQESNKYMTDEGEDFLEHSGLSSSIANALTDQSGEGHSPVPFLFAYAASRGLDREETVAWLNSLGENDVSRMRDRAHRSLDQINGDIGQMGAEGTGDPATVEFILKWNVGAMDWETFDLVLEAIGITPPSA